MIEQLLPREGKTMKDLEQIEREYRYAQDSICARAIRRICRIEDERDEALRRVRETYLGDYQRAKGKA